MDASKTNNWQVRAAETAALKSRLLGRSGTLGNPLLTSLEP